MDQRSTALAHWVAQILVPDSDMSVSNAAGPIELNMVSGDASFRRYFRVQLHGRSWMAVDAPTDTENNPAFVAIAKHWADHGIQVPQIVAYDFEQGFLLQQDFGDALFWQQLHQDDISEPEINRYYRQAIDELLKIQALPLTDLPSYDGVLLDQEMALFRDWLCTQYLQLELDESEQKVLTQAFELLKQNALQQPQVVVHRDYHSRNLMVKTDGSLGVIDFQDAVIGAASYDLVSLLRDCYVRWPATMIDDLAGYYWELARPKGIYHGDWQQFQQDFDWMGLQRHLKAAGIFARLWLRDGKSGYLKDIPNTVQYLVDISAKYSQLSEFHQWLNNRFLPALQVKQADLSTPTTVDAQCV